MKVCGQAVFREAAPEWVPAYGQALREGFRRGIQACASTDQILQIESDPGGWLDAQTTGGREIVLPNGDKIKTVPSSLYWLFVEGRMMGEASLRHELNHVLMTAGGHIGYGIHPEFQGRGYAKTLLRLTLAEAQERGLAKVLITADVDNIASWKVIEACGGALEDIAEDTYLRHGGGVMLKRYWIEL